MSNNQINYEVISSSIFACLVIVLFYLCIHYLGPEPEFRFCKPGRCYCENVETNNMTPQEIVTEPVERIIKIRRRNIDIFSTMCFCFIVIYIEPVNAHINNITDSYPIICPSLFTLIL